eukprot:5913362-Prymnesium_polylepis.1
MSSICSRAVELPPPSVTRGTASSPPSLSDGETPCPSRAALSLHPLDESTRSSTEPSCSLGLKRTTISHEPCGGSVGSALSSEKGPVGSSASQESTIGCGELDRISSGSISVWPTATESNARVCRTRPSPKVIAACTTAVSTPR